MIENKVLGHIWKTKVLTKFIAFFENLTFLFKKRMNEYKSHPCLK